MPLPPLALWAPAQGEGGQGGSKEVSVLWLVRSRLPANPNQPVEKHQGNIWLPKLLARARLLLEEWRNLMLQAWYCGIRDIRCYQKSTSLPWSGARNHSGLQNRSVLPKYSYWCFAGGKWGLSGWPFWKHPTCILSVPKDIQLAHHIRGKHT